MTEYLTPAEIQSLRLVVARARLDESGDLGPMRDTEDQVIPWREVMEWDVETWRYSKP